MTLHRIVKALGGDLYAGGYRANVPAPGHSAADRSISLLLNDGRVIIHGFGGADWRCARDVLTASGFIDSAGRLTGGGQGGAGVTRPDRRMRLETARQLWDGGCSLEACGIARRHLVLRAIPTSTDASNLRQHPRAPVSVYRPGRHVRPALMARISDAEDRLTGVELTYLDPNGRRAAGLQLSRKTVGCVPVGAAVRLAASAPDMLVAEGVVTTLAAMVRFGLPGWALRSAANLSRWTPPEDVRSVLIAADNGAVGSQAARCLRDRLLTAGLLARIEQPGGRVSDWAEAREAAARLRREEGGR